MYTKKLINYQEKGETTDDYEDLLLSDGLGAPYKPPLQDLVKFKYVRREENPVVVFTVSSGGGRKLRTGLVTQARVLGNLHFELRKDLLPIASNNFLALTTGVTGRGNDGVNYHYKGIRIHRIVKNLLFQSGDLLDLKGECSRSIFNKGGLFRDENYLLRHTGPGCLSYCNRGPDTNGSLFQVSFTQNSDLDGRYVVFGCLCSPESYDTLSAINGFGSESGEPLEDIRIADCGLAWEP